MSIAYPPARIALVSDSPESASTLVARAVARDLPPPLLVEILYLSDYEQGRTATSGTILELFHELYCGAYDLIHTFEYNFAERVFDRVIADEPSIHDPKRILNRVLRRPLTVSVHDETMILSVRNRFAVIGSGTYVPTDTTNSWASFFADVLSSTRSRTGPMDEMALWKRVKNWNVRVKRVRAIQGHS